MSRDFIDRPLARHANFWGGLVSSVIGVFGFLSPSQNTSPVTVLAFFLFGAGCALLSVWCMRRWEDRRFPFRYDRVHIDLRFQIEETGPRRSVVAHMKRKEEFRPRTEGHREWGRYQFVDDPVTDAGAFAELIKRLNHQVSFKVNGQTYTPNASELLLEPGEFRRLVIRGKFESDMHPGDRWEVGEELKLNNNFDQPTEFYVIEVNEPVQNRTIQLTFVGMEVGEVNYRIRLGSYARRKLKAKTMPQSVANVQAFEVDCSRAPVGSKIRIEWNWPADRLLRSASTAQTNPS